MTYGITSENQIIDMATINQGCDMIDAAAKDFTTSGTKVVDAANTCNADALAVDDKTMKPGIEELGESIKSLQGNVTAFTGQIRSVTSQIYSAQVQELQAYQAEQEKKRKEAEKNKNK